MKQIKKQKIVLTNQQIYDMAVSLQRNFGNDTQIYYTALISYAIDYNLAKLLPLAERIVRARARLGNKYGVFDEKEDLYRLFPESAEQANNELNELYDFQNEIELLMIPLSILDNYTFTLAQMSALVFMINPNE